MYILQIFFQSHIYCNLSFLIHVHQHVQRATSCAPRDCVWRRLDAAMAWTTARTRVTRSSAVSCFTSFIVLVVQQNNSDLIALSPYLFFFFLPEKSVMHWKNVAYLHSKAHKKLWWQQPTTSFVCVQWRDRLHRWERWDQLHSGYYIWKVFKHAFCLPFPPLPSH